MLEYIPKSKRNFAEILAKKTYLVLQLDKLILEKAALEAYLKKYPSTFPNANTLLEKTSLYHELLTPIFHSTSLSEWSLSPYEKNPNYPEHCIHESCSGNMLRSKSEVIIDTALYINKIPYRYECALYLPTKILFPDFTIRHPKTGKTFYWEHFGMMDDPEYSENAFTKLQLYNTYGIIPSVNLITTFETKTNPLNSVYVRDLLEYYFL